MGEHARLQKHTLLDVGLVKDTLWARVKAHAHVVYNRFKETSVELYSSTIDHGGDAPAAASSLSCSMR
jgi:hypothetical protein